MAVEEDPEILKSELRIAGKPDEGSEDEIAIPTPVPVQEPQRKPSPVAVSQENDIDIFALDPAQAAQMDSIIGSEESDSDFDSESDSAMTTPIQTNNCS